MSLFLIGLFIVSTGIFGLGQYVRIANSFKENEGGSKFFVKVQFSVLYGFFCWIFLWAMMLIFKEVTSGLNWIPGLGDGISLPVLIGMVVALIIAGLDTIVQLAMLPILFIVYKLSIYFTALTYQWLFNHFKKTDYCFDTIIGDTEDTGN